MATVLKETYCEAHYNLCCNYVSAIRRAARIEFEFPEIDGAKDNTNGFYCDNESCITVAFKSMEDMIRLDSKIRESLARKESPEDIYLVHPGDEFREMFDKKPNLMGKNYKIWWEPTLAEYREDELCVFMNFEKVPKDKKIRFWDMELGGTREGIAKDFNLAPDWSVIVLWNK